jgi:hypothetical protein
MNDSQSICSAMRSCASSQRQSLARGTQNHVFTENGNKYCCIGAQPGRAKRRVLSGLYRLKNGFPSNKWDSIHDVQECKSAQQAAAREDGERQENENKQRGCRCNAPGVLEHKSAQCARGREAPGVQDHEPAQRVAATEDGAIREEENNQ